MLTPETALIASSRKLTTGAQTEVLREFSLLGTADLLRLDATIPPPRRPPEPEEPPIARQGHPRPPCEPTLASA
jgi:hypothetical protein